jgi:hypothetical protein
MTKCIYCQEQEATSKEHPIPACLGMDKIRNYELLKDKLCNNCNGKIGTLEEQFCRCGPEAFFRRLKGIKGRKSNQKVNPYYRGSSGGNRMLAETKHPSKGYTILCESYEGSNDFFPARQIIVQDKNNKYHPILITETIQSFEDLQRILESKGLVDCKPIEFYATPEERDWVDRIWKGFKTGIDSERLPDFPTQKEREMAITFILTDKYFRAIAKIAFHYFLQQFNQFSGIENEFREIKNFIMNGGKVETWVRQVKGSFIPQLQSPLLTISKYAHFIVVEKTNFSIVVKMHLFVGPKGTAPTYFKVTIGKNPERIYYPQSVGHQIVYFDQKDVDGYIGIMQPMHKIRRSLL